MVNKMKNLYDVLCVTEDCSQEDVVNAYKKLANKLHPDKPGGSEESFVELNNAYKVLKNSARRARYDKSGDVREKINIDVKAKSLLASDFASLVISKRGDVSDITMKVRNNLITFISDATQKIFEIDGEISDIESYGEDVNYTGDGESIIAGVIVSAVMNKEVIKKELSEAIEIHQAAIKLLNDYEFTGQVKADVEVSAAATQKNGYFSGFGVFGGGYGS